MILLFAMLLPAWAAPCDGLVDVVTVALAPPDEPAPPPAPIPALPAEPALASLPPVGASFPQPAPLVGEGEALALLAGSTLWLTEGTRPLGALALPDAEALVNLGDHRLLALGHVPRPEPWQGGAGGPVDRVVLVDTSDPSHPRALRTLEIQGQVRLAGRVGEEVWLVVLASSGLRAVVQPRAEDPGVPPPPGTPPPPLDWEATRAGVRAVLEAGLLPAREDGVERRPLVRCEALALAGRSPGGVLARVRIPLDGGAISADAVLGGAGPLAGNADGIALGVEDRLVLWSADGRRRLTLLPGEVQAALPGPDNAWAVWARLPPPPRDEAWGLAEPPRGDWGLSALLPAGDHLREALRAPLGEHEVPASWLAFHDLRAWLAWPSTGLRLSLLDGATAAGEGLGLGGGGLNARGQPTAGLFATGSAWGVRDRVNGPVRTWWAGQLRLWTAPADIARALPGEPAGARQLAEAIPALAAAHAALQGDDGAWYRQRREPRWIGAWPLDDGLLVASEAGISRLDGAGTLLGTTPLAPLQPAAASSGLALAPGRWAYSRLARFGAGDAGDVAVCVDGAGTWVAADGALWRAKSSKLRKVSSFDGFLGSLACADGALLLWTRAPNTGLERLFSLVDGRLRPVEGFQDLPSGTLAALVPGPGGPWVAASGARAGVWAWQGGELVRRWAPAEAAGFEARALAVAPDGGFVLNWAGGGASGGLLRVREGRAEALLERASPAPGGEGWTFQQLDELALRGDELWFMAQVGGPGGGGRRALFARDPGGTTRLIAAQGRTLGEGGATLDQLGGIWSGAGGALVLQGVLRGASVSWLLDGDRLIPVLGPPGSRPASAPGGVVFPDGPAPLDDAGRLWLFAMDAENRLSLWRAAPDDDAR